jgi:SAM-dependent methyltransferase
MQRATEQIRQARALWAAGDFDAVARLIWDVGEGIVRRTGVSEGDDVLDVACGTGNASIPAAETGAHVVGVDVTPELFVAARKHAAEAGVDVEWVEGDAEALPYPDESFDVVLSTFGCMFAPQQFAAARELGRVLRPGGRIGICSWTPEGTVGDFFRTVSSHTAPPPPPIAPPTAWGSEEHVERLFVGTGIALEFERDEVVFRFDSGDEYVSFYAEKFGPVLMAREALEPEGRWEALRDDMVALFDEHNSQQGFPGQYLIALGTKASAGR